jgi:AraC family transcriptional regulator
MREIPLLSYEAEPEASNLVLPQAAQLSTKSQWRDFHLEIQQQPAHDTGEHRHQMHTLTMVTSGAPINQAIEGNFRRCVVHQEPDGRLYNNPLTVEAARELALSMS